MHSVNYDFDYLIVGSGFGGSVSACRLAEKGYSVAVMEMGKRWNAEDFASTNWNTRRWVWRPAIKLFGYFNLRIFKHATIICGNAVGGGGAPVEIRHRSGPGSRAALRHPCRGRTGR